MIEIREVEAADARTVASLAGELGYPVAPDVIGERIQSLLAEPAGTVFVACRDHAVLGWIEIQVVTHLASGARVEIAGLVVSKTVRSQGIGRLLVERAEQWCRGRGLNEMLVRSNAVREAAHRFYLREGYARTKTSAVFTKRLG